MMSTHAEDDLGDLTPQERAAMGLEQHPYGPANGASCTRSVQRVKELVLKTRWIRRDCPRRDLHCRGGSQLAHHAATSEPRTEPGRVCGGALVVSCGSRPANPCTYLRLEPASRGLVSCCVSLHAESRMARRGATSVPLPEHPHVCGGALAASCGSRLAVPCPYPLLVGRRLATLCFPACIRNESTLIGAPSQVQPPSFGRDNRLPEIEQGSRVQISPSQ